MRDLSSIHGTPLEGLTAADFAAPGPFFRIGQPPIGVDILTKIAGIEFDAAWARRVEGVVDEKAASRLSSFPPTIS